MIQLHAFSADRLATSPLPGRSAVLRIADEPSLLVPVFDAENVLHLKDCIFHDAEQSYGLVKAPTQDHADAILDFAKLAKMDCRVEHLIVQCQAGIGRSMAVCGALFKIWNQDPTPWLERGTYNRKLYAEVLAASGYHQPEPEPLVSIALRVKYPPEKLLAFLLSMRAQRYDNWEVIAFTDGRNVNIQNTVASLADKRIRVLETPEPKGRWGHPYRQMALDHCQGAWIGTQNDDNYLVPGFIEQMIAAGERAKADVVTCYLLHRYNGWRVTGPEDLGCWLARRQLVRRTPWEGTGFTADREYLDKLRKSGSVAEVGVPLVVKN